MSILAKRIKYEREGKKKTDSKWTQGYVAELIGVARTTYTAYEAGTKEPPLDTLSKIADIFDVSLDYLQGRSIARTPGGGHAYADGGAGWTQEEKDAAAAYIEMLRQQKKARAEREQGN